MNVTTKDNTNYLLTANPAEFDLESAMSARNELADALDDLSFQLSLPESEFQGEIKGLTYLEWFKKASYKKNRIASAHRKYKMRVKELQREAALDVLANKTLNFLEELSAEHRNTALAEDLYLCAKRVPRYI